MLPFSSTMEEGEFGHGGGDGGCGSLVAAIVAAVVGVDNRDRWRWCLMAVAELDGGHAITSRRSKRAA